MKNAFINLQKGWNDESRIPKMLRIVGKAKKFADLLKKSMNNKRKFNNLTSHQNMIIKD